MVDLFQALGALADRPEDSEEVRLQHRFLIAMGTLMSCGGVVWSTIVAVAGRPLPGAVPASYVVLTIVNFVVLGRTKNFGRARFLQVGISLLLPFLFQWSLGGLAASGAVMLWAMLALVGALTFSSVRQTFAWLGVFMVLALGTALADPFIAESVTPAAPTADGQRILLALNILMISPIVTGLVTYLADRQRVANASIWEANGVITQLNTALESQVARAQLMEREARRADEAKTRFLANMSHELRTPLNAIIGYAELLSEEELPADHLEDVECIGRAGQHLLQLINDVLDLSRIEAGQMDVNVDSVEIGPLVQEATEAVRHLCNERGNELHVALEVYGPQRVDSRKLKQILINLLSNAAKFTENGHIDLRVHRHENRLVIEVRDSGVGMTEESIERAFEPFTQVDDSPTREFGGTGLGLFLVRKVARLHGGDVTLTSVPGEGTTVKVDVQVLDEGLPAHRTADFH